MSGGHCTGYRRLTTRFLGLVPPCTIDRRDGVPNRRDNEMTATENSTTKQLLDAHVYKLLAASAVALIAIATVVYKLLEDWSWVDSLYFSVIAVTTVGFGDITPSTDTSKIFTVVYLLAGISIFASYLHARTGRRGANRARSSTRT
jgi:hypothetical protein